VDAANKSFTSTQSALPCRSQPITARLFNRRLRWLVLITWIVPPIFGLSFLLFIRMFTLEQMGVILSTPLEPLFVLSWIGFTAGYFHLFGAPIRTVLEAGHHGPPDFQPALERMRRFPVHFWSLFLVVPHTNVCMVFGSGRSPRQW
jgi:hypothetical protein